MGRGKEEQSKRVVKALYVALAIKDVETVHRLLAPDLEWWFHGPPTHQHLMHLLTGSSSSSSSSQNSFFFVPTSIFAFESTVLAEGFNPEWKVSWVHAWTVKDGCIVTQVKEYINTFVTVTRFGSTPAAARMTSPPASISQRVWQSKLSDSESVPGLVLAL